MWSLFSAVLPSLFFYAGKIRTMDKKTWKSVVGPLTWVRAGST